MHANIWLIFPYVHSKRNKIKFVSLQFTVSKIHPCVKGKKNICKRNLKSTKILLSNQLLLHSPWFLLPIFTPTNAKHCQNGRKKTRILSFNGSNDFSLLHDCFFLHHWCFPTSNCSKPIALSWACLDHYFIRFCICEWAKVKRILSRKEGIE